MNFSKDTESGDQVCEGPSRMAEPVEPRLTFGDGVSGCLFGVA